MIGQTTSKKLATELQSLLWNYGFKSMVFSEGRKLFYLEIKNNISDLIKISSLYKIDMDSEYTSEYLLIRVSLTCEADEEIEKSSINFSIADRQELLVFAANIFEAIRTIQYGEV